MTTRYAVKLTCPQGKVSYLTVNNRFSWTRSRAVFHAKSSTVLNHFAGYTIEVEAEECLLS